MSMEPDGSAHPSSVLKERLQNSDKQGAIERYYELLNSGSSVSGTLNTAGSIQSKSEHGDTATAEPAQSRIAEVATDITPEIALVGTESDKEECPRDLSIPLSHEIESCRTEGPQAAESAPLNEPGSEDRKQLLRRSLPGSEPDAARSAGVHSYADREEAIRSGHQMQRRFGKFPYVRKRVAFGALYTVIAVSVSIAGFSIVRGSRDAGPTTTRIQSDTSSSTEAFAIPGPAAGRSGAVVEAQKSQKQVINADSQAAQREVEVPPRSNAGQVNTIQQSTDPATAPQDPAHEPTPSVAQSFSATPKGSAEMAPHSDTGQPLAVTPKDEAKVTTTVRTKNMSAALPSRMRAAERRRASVPRRDARSRQYIRQRTPAKYP